MPAAHHHNVAVQRRAAGEAPRSAPTLVGFAKREQTERASGIREQAFDHWLATAGPSEPFVYCRGCACDRSIGRPGPGSPR